MQNQVHRLWGVRTATVTNRFAAGATVFLQKPFTTEQLQRTLRVALLSREVQKHRQN